MPLAASLSGLQSYRQFIVVMFVWNAQLQKYDKYPVDPMTGRAVNAHDPAVWRTYDEVELISNAWGSSFGPGFVLTPNDPFYCLDIDDALTPQGWSPLAANLCSRLPGAAIEVSHSGKGLHVWGCATLNGQGRKKKNVPLGIELYSELRFIALGSNATGSIGAATPQTEAAVASVVNEYFPLEAIGSVSVADSGPCEGWRGPAIDEELIRRALQSKSTRSVFGGAASFADLWDANVTVLAKSYPGNGSEPYDASSADAALAQHLAFWTGRDVGRIERLMRKSKLVRDKWDQHQTYLVELTIKNACARQVDVLQDREIEPGPLTHVLAPVTTKLNGHALTPQQTPVSGDTFLNATAQLEFFKGCVYVIEQHKILVPGGTLLKEGQFRATYGGYVFAMDAANDKITRNAWEAFTESRVLRSPRADGTCFRPDLQPGSIVNEVGRTRVNVYWPVEVPSVKGDVSPFLLHLGKLLPNERDQRILLSYLAACVQYPGIKFQWAPLIQGVEGNGKSFLSYCMTEAVGARYVHWPKARKIAAQFNAWLFGKILYCVEDIHTPDGQDIIEEIKPMITSKMGIEIEAKGVDQTSAEICGNFIFNSNHKAGLRKTANDRRFAVFYCAQQQKADLDRDGMAGDYMKRLYDWADAGGYAVVTHFLQTWPIPDEFNPHGSCQRAPDTTSTTEAIAQGRGRIEQEILEAIESETPGFCGGWVSSMAVDNLLNRMGRSGVIAPIRRRELMQSLGYDWHPHLKDGRVNNLVMPDNGKPKLFVRTGHPAIVMTEPNRIAALYQQAQGVQTFGGH